jgi:hypothetical protein
LPESWPCLSGRGQIDGGGGGDFDGSGSCSTDVCSGDADGTGGSFDFSVDGNAAYGCGLVICGDGTDGGIAVGSQEGRWAGGSERCRSGGGGAGKQWAAAEEYMWDAPGPDVPDVWQWSTLFDGAREPDGFGPERWIRGSADAAAASGDTAVASHGGRDDDDGDRVVESWREAAPECWEGSDDAPCPDSLDERSSSLDPWSNPFSQDSPPWKGRRIVAGEVSRSTRGGGADWVDRSVAAIRLLFASTTPAAPSLQQPISHML